MNCYAKLIVKWLPGLLMVTLFRSLNWSWSALSLFHSLDFFNDLAFVLADGETRVEFLPRSSFPFFANPALEFTTLYDFLVIFLFPFLHFCLAYLVSCSEGRHQLKKNVFFWPLPESPKPPPMTPIRATWSFFFGRQKRRFSAYYRTK